MLPLASLNPFITAYAQSDFFGKLIIVLLILLSALCWVVLIQKIWQMKKVQHISSAFFRALELNRENILQLELTELPTTRSLKIPHPFAEIFRSFKGKTVEILNKNHHFSSEEAVFLSSTDLEIVHAHTLVSLSGQAKLLEKHLFILSTIVTLAPFMGLLGTVWGILVTFSELQSGAAASSNAAVLGGISTALSTTVLGLVIAIPALIAYNFLKTTLRNYSSDMEDFLQRLLSHVELQYRKDH